MKTSVLTLISVATLLALMTTQPALAQIVLDANGDVELSENVSIGGVLSGTFIPAIEIDNRLGVGTAPGSYAAIYGKRDIGGPDVYAYGLKGEVVDPGMGTHDYTFGVRGDAAEAENVSYGVKGSASGSDAYAGYFTGHVYVGGNISNSSDEHLKQNIQALDGSEMLEQVNQLQPRSYRNLSEEELQQQQDLPDLNMSEGEQLGMVAQELEEVFPELVSEVTHILDEGEELPEGQEPETTTTKAVDYNGLIVVLLAAVQEQQEQIEELRSALEE